MLSFGFLSLALFVPAEGSATPRLARGDELTYVGTVQETVERPGNRLRRSHEIEVRILALERGAAWTDAAVLTLLRRKEDAPVTGALPEITGQARDRLKPPAARLDFIRLHDGGLVHRLAPRGPAPLRFDSDTPARTLPVLPLDTFAPFEFGMFPPRQKGSENSWTLQPLGRSRPLEKWSLGERDFINSERCAKLTMVQQSTDWARPIGGQTSWQRVDEVWASASGVARRVHRLIRQRDGVAATPAIVVETRYELKEQGRLVGRTYDRYRSDIEAAYVAASEMAPLMLDARRLGPEPFQLRMARLDAHLRATEPGTPYREAVLAVRRQLAAAARGEIVPISAPSVSLPTSARVGQPAPNFEAGAFQMSKALGKPIVLVFFMPRQETTDQSLLVAAALKKKYGTRVAVVPLAVFGAREAAIRDRDRLKLAIDVYDGTSARELYGVDSFPRFFAIDADGKLRWTFAGVGGETGYLLRKQVESLLAPPVATSYPSGQRNPRSRWKP